jgi:hypothetical protein
MALLRAAGLLPLLPLFACAPEPEAAARQLREAFAAARAGLPTAAPARSAAAAASPAAVPPPILPGPRRRGAAPPSHAAALIGSRIAEVERMLGDPALRRAEGDAEIWLYEAPSCRLDLVLYPAGGSLAVAYAAARAHGAAAVTEAECLAAIAAEPATRPAFAPAAIRE